MWVRASQVEIEHKEPSIVRFFLPEIIKIENARALLQVFWQLLGFCIVYRAANRYRLALSWLSRAILVWLHLPSDEKSENLAKQRLSRHFLSQFNNNFLSSYFLILAALSTRKTLNQNLVFWRRNSPHWNYLYASENLLLQWLSFNLIKI